MSGRPVRLLTAAAIAAAASLFSIASASAGCFGCGGSYGYAAPVAHYTAPVVYSYSYAAPAAYAAPSCGCGGYAASAPMYVVNQGPSYNAPVTVDAEQEPSAEYGDGSAYPNYGAGGYGYRGYGYRGLGYRGLGYRGLGYRGLGWRGGYRGLGYRGHGYRGLGYRGLGYRGYGARGLGYRGFRVGMSMRSPMVGQGGIYRGGHVGGMRPMNRAPGMVHPMR
jgi:hypothetical protein